MAEVKQSPTPDTVVEVGAVEDFGQSQSELKYSNKFREKQPLRFVVDPGLFANRRISLAKAYKAPLPILRQSDKVLLSRGNVAAIIGKAKSYKTFLSSGFAATIEDCCLGFSGDEINKVLYIDTEQAEQHCAVVLRRIHKLCGWDTTTDDDRIEMLSLREDDPRERLQKTITATLTTRPDLCIVDGIRDLLYDFNSIEESCEVVGVLMRLSSMIDCGIICVIHQNKADANARGHLGSELMNKCETTLQVVNDSGIASVTPVYSRNREIEPFSFRIDNEGLPTLCAPPKVTQKTAGLYELFRKAMFGTSWIERKALVEKVSTLLGKTQRTAERRIAEAIESNVLHLNQQGYLVLTSEAEKEEILPF